MKTSTGVHLILDGETAMPLCASTVERFLRHFPRYIEMRRITDPVVVAVEGGLCGIVVIAASHISVHTQGCRIWVDIFSCIGLDVETATRGVVRLLRLGRYHVRALPRVMPPSTLMRVNATPAAFRTGSLGKR